MKDKNIDKKNVLVTGGNSFIGKKVLNYLAQDNKLSVLTTVRDLSIIKKIDNVHYYEVKNYFTYTKWADLLDNIDTLIHTAGITAPPKELPSGMDSGLSVMMHVNRDITAKIANEAVKSDVNRIIYLSSLSVYRGKVPVKHITLETPVKNETIYAQSKYAGEVAINEACSSTNLEFVFLRPSMVVGKDTKGNFYSMANIFGKIGFSPFGAFKSHYPIVKIDTLVEFIYKAVMVKTIQSGVYLIAEKEFLTLPEVISSVAELSNKRVKHLFIPKKLLALLFAILQKKELFNHITSGRKIDTDRTWQIINTEIH